MLKNSIGFKQAVPIWLKQDMGTKNIRAIFRTKTKIAEDSVLKIATSGVYSLYVDGIFVAYGPARAGRDHFRMDEIVLGQFACDRFRLLTIEVQSYQVNSFCLMKQSPFLQAEVVTEGHVCAYTGDDDFVAGRDTSLVQKVQRFSYQRPFIEAYRLRPDSHDYRIREDIILEEEVAGLSERHIVPRHSSYPLYETISGRLLASGFAEKKENPTYVDSRSYTMIGDKMEGFYPEELEWHISREVQDYKFIKTPDKKTSLSAGEYSIWDFGVNYAGFLKIQVTVSQKTVMYAIFDEVLVEKDVDIIRDECCRAVKYELSEGTYHLKFFEPYSMKYAKIFVASGVCEIQDVAMIGYNHPPVKYNLASQDENVQLLSETAINTFRGNAVDLFTDCPTRERGGYLCDSYFTARAEHLLTGKNLVEKDFLLNFLHEDTYDGIEERMVPMCYPADHLDGVYIANWGLWLILELKDYLRRTGDRELIDLFQDKVFRLIDFHRSLENEEHLLTNIPEGVFVEWSHANEMVQDINFPSNMIYHAALQVVAELYGHAEYIEHAARVKDAILKYAYVDGFFCDHAKQDGKIIKTVRESSETCQYYAFVFGIADPESHPELFEKLLWEFSPKRRTENRYPEICFSELFFGIPLRIEMLLQNKMFQAAYEEICFYYLKQARLTGTFWETLDRGASYNHGFASIILDWLTKIEKRQQSFLW